DYCSGEIGTVDNSGKLKIHGSFPGNWVSFGEDINKELYIIDLGGDIYKLIQFQIGTEDFTLENRLQVVPNPASENITFSLKHDTFQEIRIFDTRGSLIYSKKNISNNEETIS